MKNFVIILSIFTLSHTIRVPTWKIKNNVRPSYKDIRPRRADGYRQKSVYLNQQFGANIQPLDIYISSNNKQAWNPNVKNNKFTTKPKYYKQYPRQIPNKQRFFNKPNSTKLLDTYTNSVPYITYKQSTNKPDFTFSTPVKFNNLYNTYPQNYREQKSLTPTTIRSPFAVGYVNNKLNSPIYTNLDQSFNLPISTQSSNFPEFLYQTIQFPEVQRESIPEETFFPSKQLHKFSTNNNNNLNLVQSENVTPYPNKKEFEYLSHLHKNYRDDETYQPEVTDQHYVKEETPVFERVEAKNEPISSHELPLEIPTKPIYPGEGLWAKPGIKHRPFISQQKYETLKEDKIKPDGYETFIAGEQLFDKNKHRFSQSLEDFPEEHKLNNNVETKDVIKNTEQLSNEEEEEEVDDEFVPTKLYAQVRSTENKEHLPEDEDDGKLKEAIKESKVHTIYTEEGYEDSAYDHAGHEKEAENDEGFEDLEREKLEKKEKRVPHKKYNLHLPKFSTTKYSNGGELLSDEEIEKIKQTELGLEDTDAAGTGFEEIDHSTNKYYENIPEEEITTSKPPRKQSNNFISTKETKTMTTKEKDDGNTETEIRSKVKIISQPTSSDKSHKYVKIYPKVYKTIQRNKPQVTEKLQLNIDKNPVNFSNIFIEEIITTTDVPFTTLSSTQFEYVQDEIPITTLPTTAIPKQTKADKHNVFENISKEFLKSSGKTRAKRSINDFSNLRLDAEFLPLISHQFGEIKDNTEIKYPYYTNYQKEGIHENSPLRYSEDLNNIPKKTGKRMIFYEEADKKVTCPEIPATVNPIPERVLNGEKNKETKDEQSKSPRLGGLGNKIDCLKVRYFGKNPFDSPFFGEETVGPLNPIFNDLKPQNSKFNKQTTRNRQYKQKQKFTINDIVDVEERTKFNNFGDNSAPTQDTPNIITNKNDSLNKYMTEIKEKKEDSKNKFSTPQSIETINLLTTPKYTVTLKPKHIYHQIELLKYLPNEELLRNQSLINYNQKAQLSQDIEVDNLTYESSNNSPVIPEDGEFAIHKINKGQGPPFLVFDINKFLPKREARSKNETIISREPKALEETKNETVDLPEAEELKRRRKIRKKRPPLQIFDINKFLPTTPAPIFGQVIPNTIFPKYKVVSEVSYKDDIKPNEQLHVFTDILNNIKNSSQEQQIQSSEPISVNFGSKINKSNSKLSNIEPFYQDSYLKAYGDQEVDENYYLSQITTAPTIVSSRKPNNFKKHIKFTTRQPSNKIHSTYQTSTTKSLQKETDKTNLYLLKTKQHPQYTTSTTTNNFDIGETIPVTERPQDFIEKTTKVMGLLPPGLQRYKTIHHPKRDNNLQFSNPGQKVIKINKFYVVGMRPPPKQRIILYSDFINNNAVGNNRKILIRGKRSTSKDSYSSFSRNRGKQEEKLEQIEVPNDNDDDDYVPHRPKNYYYNVDTGKIVYLTTKKPEAEQDEIEYEEIIEEPPSTTTSKPKQNPIFATATPPPKGKSFIDFVKKLQQSENYLSIPDPTTTEKSIEQPTEKTLILNTPSTKPPEFLNILAKLRQNDEYKIIEDEKEKKQKHTTTEAPYELTDEDQEFESIENIQNSPGGQHRDMFQQLGIFDVSDFIPKIKNYLPKTSYDISKYKTISRSTAKPITEDDDEEEIRPSPTTPKPFVIITEDAATIDNLNEATITKETERIPIIQRRRYTTTKTANTESSTSVFLTTSTEKPTTTKTVLKRRRPTTLTPVRTTTYAPNISTELEVKPIEKLKRNYRRRPTRIRNEPTTISDINNEDDNVSKILRRRSDSTESTSPKLPNNRFVENFKNYHRNKKHGGSYKNSNSPSELTKNVTDHINIPSNVEVIADYDKNKRHGGNYRKIIESEEVDDGKDDVDKDYENNYEEGQNSGGKPLRIKLLPKNNPEIIEESIDNEENGSKIVSNEDLPTNTEENNPEEHISTTNQPKILFSKNVLPNNIQSSIRARIMSNKFKKRRKQVTTEPTLMRLSDIVPKPEAFYKDPSLPNSVNMLIGEKKVSSDEARDLLSSTESIFSSNDDKELLKNSSSSRPVIVKDPNKRLYYYAPI